MVARGNVAEIVVEYVAIDDLRPDPGNPRRIAEEELESLTRSIREFGLVDPIIARREDKTVIGGHQRLLGARRLGLKKVPVVFLDLPLEQARTIGLALNRIAGEYDPELLARFVADLAAFDDVDLSLTGFTNDEVRALVASVDARDRRGRVETFDVDAAIDEATKGSARSQLGDVWSLGDHRILCGDAADGAGVERMLHGAQATMAFTDPPYNVDYGDHGGQRRGARRRRIRQRQLGARGVGRVLRRLGTAACRPR